jgi:hypothetical protein
MQNEAKSRKPKRAKRDFSAARALFAANVLSMRAISRRCAIPEPTLRHRAKTEGWVRGPRPDPGKTEDGASIDVSSVTSSQSPPDPATIADRGRDLIARMLDELGAITAHLGELRDFIIDATKEDADGRRRTRLLRSIGLASRVGVLKNLAAAARTLGDTAAPAGGKKVEAKGKAARVAATGRFATPPVPPKLVIDNERVDVDDAQ